MSHTILSEAKSRIALVNGSYTSASLFGVARVHFLHRKSFWLCLLLLTGFSHPAQANTVVDLITPNSTTSMSLILGPGAAAAVTPNSGMTVTTFNSANSQYVTQSMAGYEINVSQPTSTYTNVLLSGVTTAVPTNGIKPGDLIVATFYYRRVDTTSLAEANFSCDFQTINAPYTQSFSLPLRGRSFPANPMSTTDTIWRHVSIPFSAGQSYATAGTAALNFILGGNGTQTIDIAGITLKDYSQASVFSNTNSIDSTSYFYPKGTNSDGTIYTGYPISGLPLYSVGTQIQTTNAPFGASSPYPPEPYNFKLDAILPPALSPGDTLVAMFWMRAANLPTQPNGSVPPYGVAGIVANPGSPNTIIGGSGTLMVDPNAPNAVNGWREFIVPFQVLKTVNANSTDFYIYFGDQLQTVQVAGLQVYRLSPGITNAAGLCTLTSQSADYPGRTLADPWRTTAAANIAKYREGTMAVNVTDGTGKGLTNIMVSAVMTSPLFGFGCQTSSSGIIGYDNDGYNGTNQITPQDITSFCGLVPGGIEMACYKWTEWEEDTPSGQTNNMCTPAYNAETLNILRTNGVFNFRAHNLIWPSDGLCPPDVSSINNPTAMTSRINGHIKAMMGDPTVYGYFHAVDAVNEPYDKNDEMQVENGLMRYTNGDIQPPAPPNSPPNTPSPALAQATNDAKAITPWLAYTRSVDAYPRLFINDQGVEVNVNHAHTAQENYEAALFTGLENNNADIDGIGFESHFIDAFTPPLVLDQIFNHFATGLVPNHSLTEEVTEFDESESSTLALGFPPDLDLYTDYMNDYLTKVFSSPNFDFFDLWGTYDLYGPIGNTSYLLPQGEAWMSLVRNLWWTNTSATSNSTGIATLTNCFLGRYCLTATYQGITKEFYTDLPSTTGTTAKLQLSGSTGNTHVWTYAAARPSNAIEPPMQVYTNDTNAYGGAYVMAPLGATNIAPVPANQLPEMRIDTDINVTGPVSVWFHVSTANGNQDSFWTQFAGANPGAIAGTPDPYDSNPTNYPDTVLTGPFGGTNYIYTPLSDNATWHWCKVATPTLVAGKNTLYIVHRECGAELDEVLITDDPNFTPQ